jgi:2,3-bisphosphoglycerate-independent phosphoglycerate mutase
VRKAVFVILDGVGDRACAELGGATPLEAAKLPNMDYLVAHGTAGLVDPLAPGEAVATHTGTALLFGLSEAQVKRLARGPVEAAGIGINIKPGDLALRCNFATLQQQGDQLRVRDRRAGRIAEGTEELSELIRDLNLGDGIRASLYPATQHRAVLHLTGPDLSANISDTDPGGSDPSQAVKSCEPRDPSDSKAVATARAINRCLAIAHERLSGAKLNRQRERNGLLPANGIITRGAGALESPVTLLNQHHLRVAVVAGEKTVIGLANLFGYTVITQPSFTALQDTDLQAKVAAAKAALEQHDIVYIHIKGPDICAHDHKPLEKRDMLERIDQSLAPLMQEDLVWAITGDHCTDSNSGDHCGDPVPALLYVPGDSDHCGQFSESGCRDCGVGRLTAEHFIHAVVSAMGVEEALGKGNALFS